MLPAVEVNAASLPRSVHIQFFMASVVAVYSMLIEESHLLVKNSTQLKLQMANKLTFILCFSNMLTSDKKPEECDATKASTCTNADPQILFFPFVLANQMVAQDFSFQK